MTSVFYNIIISIVINSLKLLTIRLFTVSLIIDLNYESYCFPGVFRTDVGIWLATLYNLVLTCYFYNWSIFYFLALKIITELRAKEIDM